MSLTAASMSILGISTSILLLLFSRTTTTAGTDGDTAATTIYVDGFNGTNAHECLTSNVDVACKSLDYVLTNFQWNASVSLTIILKPNGLESYRSAGVFNINGGNLTLIGCTSKCYDIFPPSLSINGRGLEFTNFHNLTFTNLSFIDSMMPIMHDGESADFYNCYFYIDDSSYSHSVQSMHFLYCQFRHQDGNDAAHAVIHNFFNVTFKDCIFHSLSSKVFFFSVCQIVTFSDCQFQKNTVQIFSYHNSDSSSSNGTIYRLYITNCQFSHNGISTNTLIDISDVTEILITNTNFSYNYIELVGNILRFEYSNTIRLSNVVFMNNMGTGIAISESDQLHLLNTDFINNTGIFTGGILIYNSRKWVSRQLSSMNFTNVLFESNRHTAYYGGGIYFSFTSFCNLHRLKVTMHNAIFQDKKQGIASNDGSCLSEISGNISMLSNGHLSTPAYHVDFSTSSIALFPGKLISLPSVTVTDYFGNNVLCTATLSLMDNSAHCQLHLERQSTDDNHLLLETGPAEIQTNFYLTSTHRCLLRKEAKLILTCEDNEHASTSVNVTFKTTCPLGYSFNNSNEICIEESNDLVYDKTGTVCVPRNEWYGQMNISGKVTTVISSCTYPYCKHAGGSCQIAGYTETHQVLPWTQNEQCNGLYGGVLCRDCVEKAVFTFGASKCVSVSGCKEWQPYAIIGLAVAGQILLSLIVIHSRAKTESGVGYLYGPLFFLAVYKLLPISHNTTAASALEFTVSLFESILLLDLDILGKVTWCFFPNLNQSLNYSFRFMGPLITFLVLLVIVLIARMNFCYKIINRFMQSPIQPICLLMVMSFWSLSKTSIEIIKPVIIKDKWRFAIQPEYEYLGNVYSIVLSCIAVGILGLIYLPFILLLFFSQLLRAKVNLSRIQPLMDAFQSSYRDSCRWYSGVYLLAWVILNINMPSYIFIIIIAGMITLHSIVQPHKSTFLNAADVLLLINISNLSFLSQNYNTNQVTTILKYPLLIIPLLYIFCGGVWMAIKNSNQKPNLTRLISKNYQPLNNNTDDGSQIEMIIDSGDNDIHQQQVKPTVVTVAREPLMFDDDN